MSSSSSRGIRVVLALLALAVVAALTLGPGRIVGPARWAFLGMTDAATAPLLALFPQAGTDQVLNTLLFVPLGASVALVLGRRWWPVAIAAGAGLSFAVEIAQASIPGRVPDIDDVLWNTVGAAIGVAFVTVPRLLASLIGRRDQTTTRT